MQSLVPSLPSRNKTLVIAAKRYGETDIKVFWSFPFLLDFFTLPHNFLSGIQCYKIFFRIYETSVQSLPQSLLLDKNEKSKTNGKSMYYNHYNQFTQP